MRKEVIFAIVLGVVVGLVIAFGTWRLNTTLNVAQIDQVPEQNNHDSTAGTQFKLAIATPQNHEVISKLPLILTGITKPDSWVAISTENDVYITKSGESGAFEQEVDLYGGANQLVITAFNDEGLSIEDKLTVVYSTEFIKAISSN